MVGYVMDSGQGKRTLVALLAVMTLVAATSSAAWASGGTYYLYGGGYKLNKTVVDNHTYDQGALVTTVTHRVSLADQRSDGLKACTTVYIDKPNDGRGWILPKNFCDPDGYGGDIGRGWYTAKMGTGTQTPGWKLKVVLKALRSDGSTAYSTTKYTD